MTIEASYSIYQNGYARTKYDDNDTQMSLDNI